MRHQLHGDFLRQRRVETALHVDRRELASLGADVRGELASFASEVRRFGIGLRAHRYVLAGSHRHRTGDEPRHAGDAHRSARSARSRNTQHETRRRHDAVVSAEHGGTQPANAVGTMEFTVDSRHTDRPQTLSLR